MARGVAFHLSDAQGTGFVNFFLKETRNSIVDALMYFSTNILCKSNEIESYRSNPQGFPFTPTPCHDS